MRGLLAKGRTRHSRAKRESPQDPSDLTGWPNSGRPFACPLLSSGFLLRIPAQDSCLGFLLGLQNLTALVHAALEVEVVRAAEFAGILVLDVSGLLERVRRAAHATARRRGFSAGNGHFRKSSRGIGEASPGA